MFSIVRWVPKAESVLFAGVNGLSLVRRAVPAL